MRRTFEVEYDYFGAMKREELTSNGSLIPVTNDNRHLYVHLYTRWLLTDSISTQFNSFAAGFFRVCGGPAISLCR